MLNYYWEILTLDRIKTVVCHSNLQDYIYPLIIEEVDIIHRPLGLNLQFDDNLPNTMYKLLDNRFKNDRFTTWFDINIPPNWAKNLKLVEPVKCIKVYT